MSLRKDMDEWATKFSYMDCPAITVDQAVRIAEAHVQAARIEALNEAARKCHELRHWADAIGKTDSGNARAWACAAESLAEQIEAMIP